MLRGHIYRRLSAFAGLAGVLAASLPGCGGGGNSTPTPTPGSPIGTRARWTVLVYMNAANDLQPDSLNNVAQMASVGSDSNVNIVLQWKQSNCASSGANCGTPSYVGTRRYYIRAHSAADVTAISNGNTSSLENANERLADPGTNYSVGGGVTTSDMGNYRTLQDFVQWGTTNFPSDHLAVVVWDHGSAWFDAGLSGYTSRAQKSASVARSQIKVHTRATGTVGKVHSRAVSFDDDTASAIETWQLSQALSSSTRAIDDFIVDCSLEQMMEVAYEVRKNAAVMIGSEESPPGPGYPYDKWLAALKASGTSAQDLGQSIVSTFGTRYINDPTYDTANVGNGTAYGHVTQSMVDLSKLDGVASAMETLGQTLRGHVTDRADLIAFARNNAQFYEQGDTDPAISYYHDSKDLVNYCQLLSTGGTGVSAPTADIQQAAQAVITSLTGTSRAILANVHGNVQQSGSNGLAIYVPAAGNYRSTYTNLAFAKAAPDWVTFLTSQAQ